MVGLFLVNVALRLRDWYNRSKTTRMSEAWVTEQITREG